MSDYPQITDVSRGTSLKSTQVKATPTSTPKQLTRVGAIVDRKKVLKQAGAVHDIKSIKTVASPLCISILVWHAQ